MQVLPQFIYWRDKLTQQGLHVYLPALVNYRERYRSKRQALRVKRRENRKHFRKIRKSDGILVLNYPVRGVPNYIGGSTFAEIAVAFSMGKKIFLANPMPDRSPFKEELQAWGVERWYNLNRTRPRKLINGKAL